MPCNAYGHPPDCNCGWGGIFYANNSHAFCEDKSRFTTPNAKCPQCGALVYFYRNNGSVVYFDEIGPPWPKHGCFTEFQIKKAEAKSNSVNSGQWVSMRVFWLERGIERLCLIGTSPSRHALFLGPIKKLDVNAPWFYKLLPNEDQKFKLSTVVSNKIGQLHPIELDGWGVEGLLRPEMVKKYPKTYAIYFDENRNRRN